MQTIMENLQIAQPSSLRHENVLRAALANWPRELKAPGLQSDIELTPLVSLTVMLKLLSGKPQRIVKALSEFPEEPPFPIGDIAKGPVGSHFLSVPFQFMMFRYLTHLHPEHPRQLGPESIDPRFLKGQMAQTFLKLRQVVIIHRLHPQTFIREDMPIRLRIYLHCVEHMLSLDQWTFMLTTLMPTFVESKFQPVWNHLDHILESTLSEMNAWVLSSGSGTVNPLILATNSSRNPLSSDWTPSKSFLAYVAEIGGTVYRKDSEYRIHVPKNFWIRHLMSGVTQDSAVVRDQQQLTWIYYSQLNPQAFRDAVDSACFSNSSNSPWSTLGVVNPTRSCFAQVAYGIEAFETFDSWVLDDIWKLPFGVVTIEGEELEVDKQIPPSLMTTSSSSSSSGYSDGPELRDPVMVSIDGIYTLRERDQVQRLVEPETPVERRSRKRFLSFKRTAKSPPPMRSFEVKRAPVCPHTLSPSIMNRCTITDSRRECASCQPRDHVRMVKARAPPQSSHPRNCPHCRALEQGAILRQGRICYEDDPPADNNGYCVEQ